MSSANGDGAIDAPHVVPSDALKPRRPRRDGLTYDRRELSYALGISLRALDDLRHALPKSLPLGRRRLWSRQSIVEWLEGGCRARK